MSSSCLVTEEEDIRLFCDNMKQSLLEAYARGDGVYVRSEHDMDPLTDELAHTPEEFVYMGCTFTIATGRPAEKLAREDRRDQEGR